MFAGACNADNQVVEWTDSSSTSVCSVTGTFDGLAMICEAAMLRRAFQFGIDEIASTVNADADGPAIAIGATGDGGRIAIIDQSRRLSFTDSRLGSPTPPVDTGFAAVDPQGFAGTTDGGLVLVGREPARLTSRAFSSAGVQTGSAQLPGTGNPTIAPGLAGDLVAIVNGPECSLQKVSSSGEPIGVARPIGICDRAVLATDGTGYVTGRMSGSMLTLQRFDADLQEIAPAIPIGSVATFDLVGVDSTIWLTFRVPGEVVVAGVVDAGGFVEKYRSGMGIFGDSHRVVRVGRFAYVVYSLDVTLGEHQLLFARLCE